VKPGGAKQKGAQFELDIAKLFTKEFKIPVRRCPNSGGWATSGKKEGMSSGLLSGDLTCEDTTWPFGVECKKQEKVWTLEAILNNSCKVFVDWWLQCVRDATNCRKIPLLVFSRNFVGVFVATRREAFDTLPPNVLIVSVAGGEVYVVTLDVWLQCRKVWIPASPITPPLFSEKK